MDGIMSYTRMRGSRPQSAREPLRYSGMWCASAGRKKQPSASASASALEHACVSTSAHTYIHPYMRPLIFTTLHPYIHTYIHACMHTYIRTYTLAHTPRLSYTYTHPHIIPQGLYAEYEYWQLKADDRCRFVLAPVWVVLWPGLDVD